MFEGKNIHYSAADHKPLCSFSTRLCRQRRLNGYAFCVRHILEDPTAPFKACGYTNKVAKGACSNPVPKQDSRQFCNYHMQLSGLIQKPEPKSRAKDRPAKVKDGKVKEVKVREELKLKDMLDNCMTLEYRLKSKFNLHRHKENGPSATTPEDPYAFPDSGVESAGVAVTTPPVSTVQASPQHPPPAESPGNHVGLRPLENGTASLDVCASSLPSGTIAIPIAKLYPELAEKLEKARVKPDVRIKLENKISKTSSKSSRTMNRLQTKIAQNKIKDKLKKTQTRISQDQSTESLSPVHIPASPSSGSSQATIPLASPTVDVETPMSDLEVTNGGISPGVSVGASLAVTTVMQTPPTLATFLPSSTASSVPWMTSLSESQSLPAAVSAYMSPAYTAGVPPPSSLPSDTPPATAPAATLTPTIPSTLTTPLSIDTTSTTTHSTHPDGHCRPRPKCHSLSSAQARQRLKRHSAVRLYTQYSHNKAYHRDLLPSGFESSDSSSDEEDQLPWQQTWYVPSTEDRSDDEQDDILFFLTRTTKLSLLRSRIRRQLMQLRQAQRRNMSARRNELHLLQALLASVKGSPQATVKVLQESASPRQPAATGVQSRTGLVKQPCSFTSDKEPPCSASALPYTNHCIKHIMYNVDQQLFDFCTAKFSDNTQCCVPVFDIQHELPLCAEHAAKFDNYNKKPDQKPKKPRKKTKPSALTRPPKKGKKKRNQKKTLRPQKPMPPLEPTGLTDFSSHSVLSSDMPTSESGDQKSEAEPETGPETGPDTESEMDTLPSSSSHLTSGQLQAVDLKDIASSLDKSMEVTDLGEIEASLTADVLEKTLALDSYQSNKLLDEHDLNDVLNRIPDEAFDILSSGFPVKGEFVPSREETEALERALAAASADVSYAAQSLEKLSHDSTLLINENSNDDELTKQIADSILNQELGSPTPLEPMGDDLGTDHMQDLASISTADLKSISQSLHGGLSSTETGLGGMAQPLLHSTPLTAGTGAISVLQAQLAQGPLTAGQFQIQMPGTLATLDGTPFTISPQGALIPAVASTTANRTLAGAKMEGNAVSVAGLPTVVASSTHTLFTNSSTASALFTTSTLSSDTLLQPSAAALPTAALPTINSVIAPPNVSLQDPKVSKAAGLGHWTPGVLNPATSASSTHLPLQTHAGAPGTFNLLQTATFTPQGLPPGGLKLAYPLQAFLPGDLSSVLSTQTLDQALGLSLAPQQTLTAQPPVSMATPTLTQPPQPPTDPVPSSAGMT